MGGIILCKSIEEADREIAKLIAGLPQKPLSISIKVVLEWDKTFAEKQYEEAVFEAAYGNKEASLDAYRKARIYPEDTLVRRFCEQRITNIIRHIISESSSLDIMNRLAERLQSYIAQVPTR